LLLLHVPVAVVLLYVTVLPMQIEDGPLITFGIARTVTILVARQFAPKL
jgi:hypothetical protein